MGQLVIRYKGSDNSYSHEIKRLVELKDDEMSSVNGCPVAEIVLDGMVFGPQEDKSKDK